MVLSAPRTKKNPSGFLEYNEILKEPNQTSGRGAKERDLTMRRKSGFRSGHSTDGQDAASILAGFAGYGAVILVLLVIGAAAAADFDASLGDIVHLGGVSYESRVVYLFLTGPNLDLNGVALDNVMLPAGQGGLTRVSVDSSDQWRYDWNTRTAGRSLDAGTYTVWITTEPVGRSGIRSGSYATLSVQLGKPGISLSVPAEPGSLDIRTVPDAASVLVGGEYRGKTPLTLGNLVPGTYNVTISHFRYRQLERTVSVVPGSITEINATLVPVTGSIAITSSPPGAHILVDGSRDGGSAPVILTGLEPGNHSVSADLGGYLAAHLQVTVYADSVSNLSVTLEPVRTPPGRAGPGLPPILLSTLAAIVTGLTILRRDHFPAQNPRG